MNDTLLVLTTHFIDETVISEYRKMRNTPNVDAILAVDNNAYKCAFKNRIEDRFFFGVGVRCFFFDADLHAEMNLPNYVLGGEADFAKIMWYNGDYRLYYVRQNFPGYKYYWFAEYDVFCNAQNYGGFLSRSNDNRADLLIKGFGRERLRGKWRWTHGIDWAYNGWDVYKSFFPAERLSARAIDYLYQRRLRHKEMFVPDGNNQWVFCELFVPTELMHAGFSCSLLDEPNIRFLDDDFTIHLNDERFFIEPDDHLYHPVKSTRNEITKLQTHISELNVQIRKLFLTTLIDKLCAELSVDLKSLPLRYDNNYNSVIIPFTANNSKFKIYYTAAFLKDALYIALHCEGLYSDNISIGNLTRSRGFQVNRTQGRTAIFRMFPINFEVSSVAEVMKNLMYDTFPVMERYLNDV